MNKPFKWDEAFIYPSLQCNLNCRMCIVKNRTDRHAILDRDKALAVVEKLKQLGVSRFDLSGGEPFLYPDLLAVLREIKKDKTTTLDLVTNGTLLPTVGDLTEYLPYIDNLFISLDSTRPAVHDRIRQKESAFKNAVKGLELLRAQEFPGLGVNFVAMKENHHELAEYLQMCLELGVYNVKVLKYLEADVREPEALKLDWRETSALLKQLLRWIRRHPVKGKRIFRLQVVLPVLFFYEYSTLKAELNSDPLITVAVMFDPFRGCPAFSGRVIVQADGLVTGCPAMAGNRSFTAGHILKMSRQELAAGWQQMKEKLNLRAQLLHSREPCRSCRFWKLCRGGCPVSALRTYDTLEKPDPSCWMAIAGNENGGSKHNAKI